MNGAVTIFSIANRYVHSANVVDDFSNLFRMTNSSNTNELLRPLSVLISFVQVLFTAFGGGRSVQ